MTESEAARRQAGFSLVELMIAMVITLVISGAIYGLIASGQTAFKRDPEISDRQQNIRVAMDIVQKDIANAGVGMNAFFQAFGTALDGIGAVPAAGGGQTDHLLIFGNSGECPDVNLQSGPCPSPTCPYSGANINAAFPAPACYTDDQFVIVVFGNVGSRWGLAHNIHAANQMINFPNGQNGAALSQLPGVGNADLHSYGPSGQVPTGMAHVQIIRYEVANDPSDGLPGLWRSESGGMDAGTGVYTAAPGPGGNWQLIARAIDDFQVQYRDAAVGWSLNAGAPAIVENDYTTIIQEVRVTLSSRTASIRASKDAQNVMALRGQLTSVSSPRAALGYLAGAPPGSPQQWQ